MNEMMTDFMATVLRGKDAAIDAHQRCRVSQFAGAQLVGDSWEPQTARLRAKAEVAAECTEEAVAVLAMISLMCL